MLHYIKGSQLTEFPKLRHTMFTDRRLQFIDRLNWDLSITSEGYEIDQYDKQEAVYVICSDGNGNHRGSMRFLPTTGRTMINDHFSELIPGVSIQSNRIWESTRLCVSRDSTSDVVVSLLAGAAKMMKENQLYAFIGVFNAATARVYRRFSTEPIVLGSDRLNGDKVSVGLWGFDTRKFLTLIEKSQYSADEIELMYVNSAMQKSMQLIA